MGRTLDSILRAVGFLKALAGLPGPCGICIMWKSGGRCRASAADQGGFAKGVGVRTGEIGVQGGETSERRALGVSQQGGEGGGEGEGWKATPGDTCSRPGKRVAVEGRRCRSRTWAEWQTLEEGMGICGVCCFWIPVGVQRAPQGCSSHQRRHTSAQKTDVSLSCSSLLARATTDKGSPCPQPWPAPSQAL